MIESLKLLKKYKFKLTKQQYRTLKGQILNGDIQGFKKGLNTLKTKLVNEKKGNDKNDK